MHLTTIKAGRWGRSTHQTKIQRTRKPRVLRIRAHLRIRKKERHGEHGADDHGAAAAPEIAAVAHETREDGRGHAREVGRSVVLPGFALADAAELGAAGFEVDGRKTLNLGSVNEEIKRRYGGGGWKRTAGMRDR